MAERGVRRGATNAIRRPVANQENDENTYYLRNKTTKPAGVPPSRIPTSDAQAALKGLMAKGQQKRSALGDVSNLHPQVTHGKDGKDKALKETSLKEEVKVTASEDVKPKVAIRSVAESKPQAIPAAESKAVQPLPTRQIVQPSVAPADVEMEDAAEDQDYEDDCQDEDDEQEEEEEYDQSEMEVVSGGQDFENQEWDDLDADDAGDPLMVAEYVVEIFDYLRALEKKTMPRHDYMTVQKGLQWKQRAILVDWLVEVHWKFRLLPETLFLAVNILDRFLSKRVVLLQKLQLVGIASMLIASKFEEGLSPSIDSFVFMADGGYQSSEILTMERQILYALDFNLSYPSPLNFLRRASKAENYDIQTRTLAKYFMEITLLSHEFLSVAPSLLSAASLWVARAMLSRGCWDANLRHYSGYTSAQLQPTADMILNLAASIEKPDKFIYKLSKPNELQAIPKKYTSSKFMKASVFVKEYLAKQGN